MASVIASPADGPPMFVVSTLTFTGNVKRGESSTPMPLRPLSWGSANTPT